MFHLYWQAVTHQGCVRERNEDAHGSFPLPEPVGGRVFVVADGMGGHRAGHIASRVTLASLEQTLTAWSGAQPGPVLPDKMVEMLVAAVETANRALLSESVQSPDRTGMGTTLTAAHLNGLNFSFAHVGDSRLYRLGQQGALVQISRDHALVAEMVRAGTLTEDEARVHPQRNVLTQALGLEQPPDIDRGTGKLEPDEALVLCTDGLTNVLEDGEIAAMLLEQPDQADRLIDLANQRGGPDNVTLVVIRPAPADRTGNQAAGSGGP